MVLGGLVLLRPGHLGLDLLDLFHRPTAPQAQDEVEGRLLLDVVVRQRPTILELLPGEDEALLVGGDALLVLDFGLDVVDGVGGLDVEGDGLTREGLDKYLQCCFRCLWWCL